jgi:membrane protease YdiL (CAAX protease family)
MRRIVKLVESLGRAFRVGARDANTPSNLVVRRATDRERTRWWYGARPNHMMPRRLFPLAAVALVASASAYAFAIDRAASPAIFAALGSAELAAAALGIYVLKADARLADAWAPRWGDLRNGFLAAVFAWAATTGLARLLAGVGDFDAHLLRLYLQAGPVGATPGVPFVLGVAAMAALEETVWRCLVPRALEAFVPPRLAWMLAAVLFAIAHMPSVSAMAVMGSPNVLFPAASLGLGIFLGALAAATGRVVPGFFAHLLFNLAIFGPFALVHLSP